MKLVREVNGRTITLTPLNSTTLELTTTGVVTDISYSNDLSREITSITIGDEYRITKYGTIKIPFADIVAIYDINFIRKVSAKKFLLLSHLRNRTTTYILPCLGILPVTKLNDDTTTETKFEISRYCQNTYLINAYIDSKNLKRLEIVFRFSNHSTYKRLESCLLDHPEFIKVNEGYKKDDYVSFVMGVPEDFQKDVIYFLRGQYSLFSEELKRRILQFHRAGKKSRLYKVLYKQPDLRTELEEALGTRLNPEQELDSVPDRQQEFIELL